jgi:tetratricopeptide (TPR) repeat protein
MKLLQTILKTTFPTAAVLLLLPVTGLADTIFRSDGPPIEDCKVQRETFNEVEYKSDSGSKKTIASDKVVRIVHEKVPRLLDSARAALADSDFATALGDIELYVDGVLSSEKGDRKYPWAPAYAMFRLIELYSSVGDPQGMIEAADQLIEKAPESLYVPIAYLAKADALADTKKTEAANKALQDLLALATEKNLSARWKLETELSLALLDTKVKGDKLRTKLETLSKQAEDYPTVLNRAKLAEAESFLLEKEFTAAESILTRTIDSGRAGERTMAGAYTGLGDCQFQRAVDLFKTDKKAEAEALLEDAVLSYMRVVQVYEAQSRYVAKAMFFAGRAFDQFQQPEIKQRAKLMYREVVRQFPESSWAQEARDFL